MIVFHTYEPTHNAIEAIKAQIQGEIDKQFSARVREMFRDLLKVTPQWSGNYVSNWRIVTDPNRSDYTEYFMKGHTRPDDKRQMGDGAAIAVARNISNIQGSSKFLSYQKPVYFLNNTPTIFEEDTIGTSDKDGVPRPDVIGYSQPFPGANYPEVTKVRPENLVNGVVALGSYIRSKYS